MHAFFIRADLPVKCFVEPFYCLYYNSKKKKKLKINHPVIFECRSQFCQNLDAAKTRIIPLGLSEAVLTRIYVGMYIHIFFFMKFKREVKAQ